MYEITCSPECSHGDTSDTHVTITGLKAATEYTLSVVEVINGDSSDPSGDGKANTSKFIIVKV